jgi:hypothetical protein
MTKATLSRTAMSLLDDPKPASKWRWITDNSLRAYGTVNIKTRTVRINVKLHKRSRALLLDTFIHEHLHINYPFWTERKIEETANIICDFLTPKERKVRLAYYLSLLKPEKVS